MHSLLSGLFGFFITGFWILFAMGFFGIFAWYGYLYWTEPAELMKFYEAGFSWKLLEIIWAHILLAIYGGIGSVVIIGALIVGMAKSILGLN